MTNAMNDHVIFMNRIKPIFLKYWKRPKALQAGFEVMYKLFSSMLWCSKLLMTILNEVVTVAS